MTTNPDEKIEKYEKQLSSLSFWNVLDTDEQCELRITLAQIRQEAYKKGYADGYMSGN